VYHHSGGKLINLGDQPGVWDRRGNRRSHCLFTGL